MSRVAQRGEGRGGGGCDGYLATARKRSLVGWCLQGSEVFWKRRKAIFDETGKAHVTANSTLPGAKLGAAADSDRVYELVLTS